MEEGKRSRVHPHFMQSASPFGLPFSSPCSPCFIGFTNGNQWFLEEGGEELASEIKGMIFRLIRDVHAVPNFFRHRIR